MARPARRPAAPPRRVAVESSSVGGVRDGGGREGGQAEPLEGGRRRGWGCWHYLGTSLRLEEWRGVEEGGNGSKRQ